MNAACYEVVAWGQAHWVESVVHVNMFKRHMTEVNTCRYHVLSYSWFKLTVKATEFIQCLRRLIMTT